MYTSEAVRKICEANHLEVSGILLKSDFKKMLLSMPTEEFYDPYRRKQKIEVRQNEMPNLRNVHKFDELKDDLCIYLETFELQCRAYEVPVEKWPVLLSSYLTGIAQRAGAFMTTAQKMSWNSTCAELRRAYKLTPEYYRQKFFEKRENFTTYSELAISLKLYLLR
jgi:hypothetical protein